MNFNTNPKIFSYKSKSIYFPNDGNRYFMFRFDRWKVYVSYEEVIKNKPTSKVKKILNEVFGSWINA